MDSTELQRIKNKYDIVGNDAALNRALETAVAIAPTDLTALITGESGVGKENIPKIIHQFSRRRNAKFLAVNCGALPEGTINAELFGHEKGAFTGAIGERKGYFEEANGGTLFLDEIGELPKETQAMLLRVLQDGEYIKVGSSKVEKTDVRVICATNVDLSYAVATGKFRQDLFYRINAIQIQMPSLRERKADIDLLFRKFSSDFAEKYNLCKIGLTHDAILKLTSYRWPGNIRQLKNIAESVTALHSRPAVPGSERVEIDGLTIRALFPDEKDSLLPAPSSQSGSQNGGSAFSESEKQTIIKALIDLKQEVDELKKKVADTPVPQTSASALAFAKDEPEEQSQQVDEQTQEAFAPARPATIRSSGDELIERALAKYDGNVKLAAAELGISERTIYRRRAEKKKQ